MGLVVVRDNLWSFLVVYWDCLPLGVCSLSLKKVVSSDRVIVIYNTDAAYTRTGLMLSFCLWEGIKYIAHCPVIVPKGIDSVRRDRHFGKFIKQQKSY